VRFTNTRTAARAALVDGLIVGAVLTSSCGSPCGLGLVSRTYLASSSIPSPGPVPCCGGFLYQDVDLSAPVVQQVDLANSQVNSGHLDAFLTSIDCAELFDNTYNGSATHPLCKLYVGPVPAGTVSARVSLPKGTYRAFAQAWASNNDTTNAFSIDVGVYGDSCAAQGPIGP
jgi:hypothetical protein